MSYVPLNLENFLQKWKKNNKKKYLAIFFY